MKTHSKRTYLTAFVALSFSLLAACSSAPQAIDPVDDLAALADANGDIEATLEVVSVGSSGAPAQSGLSGQWVYFKIEFNFRKRIDKSSPLVGVALTANLPVQQNVDAAVAAGDQMRIRGRVRKVGSVPAFIGVMHSQTAGASAAAVTPPTLVILVAQGKTLPPTTQSGVTLSDVLVSSYLLPEVGDEVIVGILRTPDGRSAASVRITSPRDPQSGLPTGRVVQARLSGQIEWVQTPIGMAGQLTGTLKIGPQTVSIEGWLDGSFDLKGFVPNGLKPKTVTVFDAKPTGARA